MKTKTGFDFSLKTWLIAMFTQKKVWRVTKFYGPECGKPSGLMSGSIAQMVLHEDIDNDLKSWQ